MLQLVVYGQSSFKSTVHDHKKEKVKTGEYWLDWVRKALEGSEQESAAIKSKASCRFEGHLHASELSLLDFIFKLTILILLTKNLS